MSKKRSIYVGPIAVGFLPKLSAAELDFSARLWSPLRDDATHHWVPECPCSSPIRATIERYSDGSRGSFILDTSSEAETALFEADFKTEIEILQANYERVEIIFGVISY